MDHPTASINLPPGTKYPQTCISSCLHRWYLLQLTLQESHNPVELILGGTPNISSSEKATVRVHEPNYDSAGSSVYELHDLWTHDVQHS